MGTLAALALIRIAADFRPFPGAISMIDLAIWLGLSVQPDGPSPTDDQAIDKGSRVSGADCADGWNDVTIPWNL
jgi:hypothetical protein